MKYTPRSWYVVFLVGMSFGCSGQPTTSPDGPSKTRRVIPVSPVRLPALEDHPRGPTIAAAFFAISQCAANFTAGQDLPALKYPTADVRHLGDDLHRLGVPRANLFTRIDEDASFAGVVQELETLRTKLKRDDTLFVFFSCHGVGGVKGEAARLVLHDGYLSIPLLMERLSTIETRNVLVCLDCCHAGAVGRPAFAVGSDVLRRENGGLAWFSSARANEQAYEADVLERGVFSYFLSEVLRDANEFDKNADGYLDFDELVQPVSEKTKQWTEQRGVSQTPQWGKESWRGEDNLIQVYDPWQLRMEDPCQLATVEVAFDPRALRPGDSLYLLVVPLSLPEPRYYQQGAARIVGRSRAMGRVHLGRVGQDVGEDFLCVLVQADAELARRLASVPQGGAVSPPLNSLPIRARLTVRRTR